MDKLARVLLAILVACAVGEASYPAQAPADDITSRAKQFVEAFMKEDYSTASKDFDENMKRVLPVEKLREVHRSLITNAGAFKRQVSARTEKQQQYDIVFVTCEFALAAVDAKVVFDSQKQITGLFFVPAAQPPASEYKPPAYARPDSFSEKEVTVGSGEWALPGTLTLPNGQGPFPAAVLVHGSGPNDRDESIGPNKPFRDIAWGLATRGIAVLRYDKRTKVHSLKFAPLMDRLTVKEETIDDVLLAVALLRETPGIDAGKVFVIGHSLGAIVAPRVAKLDPKIAGLVLLAGATRPAEDLIVEQITYIRSLDGVLSDAERAEIEKYKSQAAAVKDPNLSTATPRSSLPLGIPATYWLDLRQYDPAKVAAQIGQPMLILQGERDYQVTMEDFQGWKRALGSRKDVEFKSYPKLNHIFTEGEGKLTPAEYGEPGNVAEYVIEDIAKWIKSRK
ncbi:MAG TPA: alpha/beta fold hydrolase [Blastocatellia bacterium]|nr:alpha/beta fold hydrolase [Blastocatellia bacterium]